jgi:hypothetical protein
MNERVIEVPTGRRGADGVLEIKQFTSNVISVTIARVGERTPPLLLTRAQAVGLRDALDEIIPELEKENSPEKETYVEGVERRRSAA